MVNSIQKLKLSFKRAKKYPLHAVQSHVYDRARRRRRQGVPFRMCRAAFSLLPGATEDSVVPDLHHLLRNRAKQTDCG